MPQKCCIKGCWQFKDYPEAKRKGITFHKFPLSARKKCEWVFAIDEMPNQQMSFHSVTDSTRVCSEHFAPDDYEAGPEKRRNLKESAIPRELNGMQVNGKFDCAIQE